jgi:N-acetylmuramoyl-L-alanine amidase
MRKHTGSLFRAFVLSWFRVSLTIVALGSVTVFAEAAKTMYLDAMAREQTVRASMSAGDVSPALLDQVRSVVAAYEAVVKRFPTSGYSDNALWQAGRLSLETFERFGQSRDRDTAVRLLRRLARAYVTSKLAKQVPEQLARAGETEPAASAPEKATSGAPSNTVEQPASARSNTPPTTADAPARPAANTSDAAAPPSALVTTRPASLATIKAIHRAVIPGVVRITIELDAEVAFHEEQIPNPARVFVDLSNTRPAPALVDRTLRFDGDADVVRQVRVGRHANNTTRVVLDGADVTSYSVYTLYEPYRIVIDCERTFRPKNPPSPQLRPLVAHRLATGWTRPLPATTPRSSAAIAAARTADPIAAGPIATATRTTDEGIVLPQPRESGTTASITAPAAATSTSGATANAATTAPRASTSTTTAPAASASTTTAPPSKNLGGGFSIARQLGLGVSRIVIDPGHGGHDPGAKGKTVTEAELVLDVALRLEKLLQKVPGVEVVLTRRTDEFIALQERTAIANREGADLFLSIHANASNSAMARGIETYFLNFANNLSAAAVAARENAASGQAMGALPDIVKAIALNNKLDESRDFATQVQRAMIERLRAANKTVKDLGVKQAPFVVLIGAAMPSVLAEISFVTNAQEAKLLKASNYRDRIAEALFDAIRKYQTSLKHATAVALQ